MTIQAAKVLLGNGCDGYAKKMPTTGSRRRYRRGESGRCPQIGDVEAQAQSGRERAQHRDARRGPKASGESRQLGRLSSEWPSDGGDCCLAAKSAELSGRLTGLPAPAHRPKVRDRQARETTVPTPQAAIRLRCLDCSETRTEIRECEFRPGAFNACSLWQFRMGRNCGRGSRLKAIRRYCLWCMAGSPVEVRACSGEKVCAMWPYRFGKRPV
jgi:hypothetical protein